MISNYELMKQQMQQKFLTYDVAAMKEQFALHGDENYLYLKLFSGDSRISLKDGKVECMDPVTGDYCEAGYNEAMTIFDILCCAQKDARPSGELTNMNSLSTMASGTTRSGGKGFFQRETKAFDQDVEKLQQALIRAGGVPVKDGDAAADFDAFCGLRVRFRFWASDDEFDPEIQFLWDSHVLEYMHYETVWFANHALIKRIEMCYNACV